MLSSLDLLCNSMLRAIAVLGSAAASSEVQPMGMLDVSVRSGLRDTVITCVETVGLQDTVDLTVECLLRATQHEFPVVDGTGVLRDVLTQDASARAPSRTGGPSPEST